MTSDPDAVAYDEGDYVVICDRRNPNAWLRSDTVLDAADAGAERTSPR